MKNLNEINLAVYFQTIRFAFRIPITMDSLYGDYTFEKGTLASVEILSENEFRFYVHREDEFDCVVRYESPVLRGGLPYLKSICTYLERYEDLSIVYAGRNGERCFLDCPSKTVFEAQQIADAYRFSNPDQPVSIGYKKDGRYGGSFIGLCSIKDEMMFMGLEQETNIEAVA